VLGCGPTGRPASYFDLQHSSEQAARTPRPPPLASRHSSQEFPSKPTRSAVMEPSGSSRSGPSQRRDGPSGNFGSGVFGGSVSASPAWSPTQSPRQLHAASFPAADVGEGPQSISCAIEPTPGAGSRTPRSHPARAFASPRSPRLRSASPPRGPASPSPVRARPSLILTREEEEVLEARFDLMTDAELAAVHTRWEAQQALTGASSSNASSAEGKKAPGETPLFPEPTGARDHPLRVLARACRKLYRAEREGQTVVHVESSPAPVAVVHAPEPDEVCLG
jgi:hypothetical protein